MGFVDEKDPVAGGIKEPLQMHHRVEQIIVVPDDHIAPFAQVQSQFKGAHRELPGCVCQCGAVKKTGAGIQQGRQGVFHPVVIAVGIGAHFRQAGGAALSVRVQAGFLLCRQGHAAQGKPGVGCLKPRQRILGGGLRRVAGGEVKEFFPAAFAHGFQGREEHAHGFADAGGILTEQPGAAFARCPGR